MNEEDIIEDIKKDKAIETMASSVGGKIVIKEIKSGVLSTMEQLSGYKELSHTELIALCARLTEKLTFMRLVKNAKLNKDMAIEALEELD